ncbi:coiled-coil domain-containing protein [Adlercreutzia wanghongyangiae]
MTWLLAMLLAVPCLVSAPPSAWGITEETEAKISDAQRQIEESAAAYDAAVARLAELEQQTADNEQRIAELEEELPEQQERSDEAVTVLYKMNREGRSLINMVLASESITDFLVRVDYLTRYQDRNLEAIRALAAMREELEATRASLDAARAEAEQQQAAAESSLAAAQQAREEAQRQAQEEARREREAQEAARKAAEEAAAKKAAEEAAAQEAEQEAPDEEAEAPEEVPSTSASDDGADWSSDKASFVEQWAPRINRYLSGSPLAGTGETFASAAWDYGVDPRWSPAISAVESSKGAACFRPHNAWGWGNASWGSWEEAINAHVSGLARGYGYTLSESAAKKYCPPNWQHWYDRCAEEMNSI